jgi:hypothetical protein
MNLQDEVENNNYSISTEESDHVKEVELRVPSWRFRASNDMLVTVRSISLVFKRLELYH